MLTSPLPEKAVDINLPPSKGSNLNLNFGSFKAAI